MATYCHSFQNHSGQIPFGSIRVQGPSKRPSSGHLYPVSSVKERNRKGGKCEISRVLQSPVSRPQVSPKMEASHRLKQAQHFSSCRKVQNGNSRVHRDLPDSRGMGIIERPVGRLPSHPHPSKLKEIPKVLPQVVGQVFQFTSLPFGLATASQVFTMIVKEVKLKALSRGLRLHQYLDDWLIKSQSQEEAQLNTQAVVDLTQSLGWIINQEKSELKPTQVFSFVGYGYHLDSALVKPTQERWLKLQDFYPTTQVKTCFDCKIFDVASWVACLNGGNDPGGTPSHEALSVSSQGALKISSVAGQPPSLDRVRYHFCTPRLVAEPCKRADLHPKDHIIQLFTDASNEGWGTHLDQRVCGPTRKKGYT